MGNHMSTLDTFGTCGENNAIAVSRAGLMNGVNNLMGMPKGAMCTVPKKFDPERNSWWSTNREYIAGSTNRGKDEMIECNMIGKALSDEIKMCDEMKGGKVSSFLLNFKMGEADHIDIYVVRQR